MKKFTSTANEFLFHKCRNDRKIGKKSHLKKFTSPANDFLLHKYRNNKKMRKCKKKNQFIKKYTSPANELHPVEAIGKLKKKVKK